MSTFAPGLVIQIFFLYLYKREFGCGIRSSARYCETHLMKSNSRYATVSKMKKWEGAFQGEARKPAKSKHR
ncbi:MAG: hypothetical protein EL88_08990 [Phocaeicola dorei]|nr:MAG: hypothetical protein EL88_08990 [Phocaeicola dorei]AND20680.1 hypothetical protein ABI39_15640 [Phocaeicola dorei CL03T12C01]DAQ76951.1 MAG TPA: hypothetical protein [Caudoviricetes sp.]